MKKSKVDFKTQGGSQHVSNKINPVYGIKTDITMDTNPTYGTATSIKMDTNPAYEYYYYYYYYYCTLTYVVFL